MIANPLWGNVVIQPVQTTKTTKAGISLPENTSRDTLQGIVLAFGPGSVSMLGSVIEVPLSVGASVLFPPEKARSVRVGGESLYIIDHQYVLAVLEEGEEK